MALIKCGKCGKEISDKAFSCPGCGNTIENNNICASEKAVFTIDKKTIKERVLTKRQTILFTSIILFVLLIIFGVFIGYKKEPIVGEWEFDSLVKSDGTYANANQVIIAGNKLPRFVCKRNGKYEIDILSENYTGEWEKVEFLDFSYAYRLNNPGMVAYFETSDNVKEITIATISNDITYQMIFKRKE